MASSFHLLQCLFVLLVVVLKSIQSSAQISDSSICPNYFFTFEPLVDIPCNPYANAATDDITLKCSVMGPQLGPNSSATVEWFRILSQLNDTEENLNDRISRGQVDIELSSSSSANSMTIWSELTVRDILRSDVTGIYWCVMRFRLATPEGTVEMVSDKSQLSVLRSQMAYQDREACQEGSIQSSSSSSCVTFGGATADFPQIIVGSTEITSSSAESSDNLLVIIVPVSFGAVLFIMFHVVLVTVIYLALKKRKTPTPADLSSRRKISTTSLLSSPSTTTTSIIASTPTHEVAMPPKSLKFRPDHQLIVDNKTSATSSLLMSPLPPPPLSNPPSPPTNTGARKTSNASLLGRIPPPPVSSPPMPPTSRKLMAPATTPPHLPPPPIAAPPLSSSSANSSPHHTPVTSQKATPTHISTPLTHPPLKKPTVKPKPPQLLRQNQHANSLPSKLKNSINTFIRQEEEEEVGVSSGDEEVYEPVIVPRDGRRTATFAGDTNNAVVMTDDLAAATLALGVATTAASSVSEEHNRHQDYQSLNASMMDSQRVYEDPHSSGNCMGTHVVSIDMENTSSSSDTDSDENDKYVAILHNKATSSSSSKHIYRNSHVARSASSIDLLCNGDKSSSPQRRPKLKARVSVPQLPNKVMQVPVQRESIDGEYVVPNEMVEKEELLSTTTPVLDEREEEEANEPEDYIDIQSGCRAN